MKTPRNRYSPDFIVTCACGTEYHTDEAHIGKSLRCRCGRTVLMARPAPEPEPPEPAPMNAHRPRRRRSQPSAGFVPIIPVKHRRWRSPFADWSLPEFSAWRQLPRAVVRKIVSSLRRGL